MDENPVQSSQKIASHMLFKLPMLFIEKSFIPAGSREKPYGDASNAWGLTNTNHLDLLKVHLSFDPWVNHPLPQR